MLKLTGFMHEKREIIVARSRHNYRTCISTICTITNSIFFQFTFISLISTFTEGCSPVQYFILVLEKTTMQHRTGSHREMGRFVSSGYPSEMLSQTNAFCCLRRNSVVVVGKKVNASRVLETMTVIPWR